MRKIGIDLGDKRIGLAVSDLMGIIANGLETYYRKNDESDYQYVADVCRQMQADTAVIGLPLNMDGTKGDRALLSEAFGTKLKEYIDIEVVYQDERLTSVSAERALLSADMRRDKRKKMIDKVAAAIILQSYLDYKK